MKDLWKISILIFTSIFPISCSNDDGNSIEYPYYQFDSTDAEFITKYNYSVGEIITYENQFNEQLNFRVIKNERKKEGYTSFKSFSGGGGVSSYHEIQITRFEIIENRNYENNGLVNYIFSKSRDTLKNGINFPLWNIAASTFIDELQNHANVILTGFNDVEKTKVNSNGHLFERVVAIESKSNDVNQDYSYGALSLNVNKVHYDYDFGIVQFDDIEGNQWKVNYTE